MTGIYSLFEGKTLGGRYRVDRLLGRGGMGAVFHATDLHLVRNVAVKVIALEPDTPEQAATLRARFRREAHVAAKLRHPHVVTLHDFGTDPIIGLDFIVMELLEGEDVQSRLRRTGPFPWRQASRILYEAARGLGAGHRVGLVHRDVKPANLFLENGPDGKRLRTLVLDFGIAQLKSEGTSTATHLTVLGHAPLSPPYASPEQQRGERELTPAADVYELGVTAFEMLTGFLPFTEAQRASLAAGVRVQPPSLTRIDPGIPDLADQLIRKSLSLRPGDRPPDGDSFAREISAVRRGAKTRPPPHVPAPAAAPGPAAIGNAVPEPRPAADRSPARATGWAPVLTFVGTVVAIVGALNFWNSTREHAPSDTPLQDSFTDVSPSLPGVTATDQIAHIREVYRRIEAGAALLRERRLPLGDFGRQEWPWSDSVYATVYSDRGEIPKIRVREYRETVRTSLLFYYDAGRLVFVHEVQKASGSSVDRQHRFYFADRAMIRWLDPGGGMVSPGTTAFSERSRTLLRISDNLLARTG